MSVIIRLQNLPWSANAPDIRQYFQGLGIPEGGVHIVGGELGDAFIAFSTDEDARQAFNLNNGKIKGVQIKLMLSSRTEMQKVIETARNQSLAAFMQSTPQVTPPAATPILPALVPITVPEIKKDEKDNKSKDTKIENKSRERRRSRSKSRDRKDRDRSRERDRRDRRRRDRSRSRSRERRDRRRRDRSRSRDRTKSKDRDYHRTTRRSNDKSPPITQPKENQIVWEAPLQQEIQLQQPSAATILGAIPSLLAAKSFLEQQQKSFQQPMRDSFVSRWGPSTNHEPTFQPPERFPNEDRFNDNCNRPSPFENITSFNNRSPIPGTRTPLPLGAPLANRFGADSRDRSDRGNQLASKNCCVQLHSFMGGFGEIRRFFQGLFIHNTGIKFVNDDYGKRTGVVYIRFAYSEGKEQALLRSGGILRGQVVAVTHLDDDIFEQTVDRYHPHNNSGNDELEEFDTKIDVSVFATKNGPFTTLLVEELPNYAKEQDLLKMFSDYSLISIILINKPRKITLAYVKFSNPEDAKAALEAVNKHSVDGKPVTVKPCTDEEFEAVQREQGTFIEEPMRSNESFKNSNVLFLSRLPLKTIDRDISDFFSDIGIRPTNIHMIINNMGFVGDAFCEFGTIKDAKAALEKNGAPLGTSIVLVKSVDRSVMEDALGMQQEDDEEDMNEDPFEIMNRNDDSDRIIDISERGDIRDRMIKMGEMSGRYGDIGNMPPKMDFQATEKLGPLGFPPRMSTNMRPMMGLNTLRPPFQPRAPFLPPLPPRGSNFMPPRPRRFLPSHFPQQHINGNEEIFGPPGCTVLMENVPFKATVEEILDFFSGYAISPDNILRRYNPNGKPSGESKVIFKNAEEAYQAVHEKQEGKIRDRTIFLSLC